MALGMTVGLFLICEGPAARAAGKSQPDLVVSSIGFTSPVSPVAGQSVTFSCVVKNVGKANVASGAVIGVGYLIDGVQVSWGTVYGPLRAGQSIAVGTNGGAWVATEGSHTFTAAVDDVNRIAESNETNNTLAQPLPVYVLADKGLFGINLDPPNPAGNPSASALKAAGVRWVRMEWKSAYGHSFYDPLIAAYRAAGVNVLLLVDYASTTSPPKPACLAPDADWTTYRGAFTSAVSGLAAHYGDGVDAWEIWNEPDICATTGYDPGVPAAHFGLMLRDAVEAIRPWSTRPILSGGIKTGDTRYLASARTAAGGLTVDAVGVHPYERRAPDGWTSTPSDQGNMSAYFDAYLGAFGLPLWVTEVNTNLLDRQAEYLQNVFVLAGGRYAGQVPVVLWFCWSDGMVPPFGLLGASGTQKPAYTRYQLLATPW
jgi:hypothetical protein